MMMIEEDYLEILSDLVLIFTDEILSTLLINYYIFLLGCVDARWITLYV